MKYLVVSPIHEEFRESIINLMREVRGHTALPASEGELPPHITFGKPIVGVRKKSITRLAEAIALRARSTRIRTEQLVAFGSHYIVLPVRGTQTFDRLWADAAREIAQLPQYKHGQYDKENTPHITIASKTSAVFKDAWPKISRICVRHMSIPVEVIELYRKPVGTASKGWEAVASFPFSED